MTISAAQAGPQRSAHIGMWLVTVFAFASAVMHVRAVCWSLIASDNWNHIQPLLSDAIAGRLDIGNFLVQRAGVDHAQPLNKLVMLVNYRWFGLDFLLEGFLGMAFGAAAALVLWRVVTRDAATRGGAPVDVRGVRRPVAFFIAFAAAASVFYSLNSSFIYTYSMVTMWFALYLLSFAMVLAAWHALLEGRRWPLALATFVLGIVGDDSAFLDASALGLALLLYGAHARAWRRTLPALATIVAAVLVSRVVYALFGETSGATQAIFNQPLTARIAALAAQWRDGWTWFALPTVSGLANADVLRHIFGAHAIAARNGIGVVMLVAHLAFWWAALRLRSGAAWLAAVTVMLMFYAHVGAILFARVFVKGVAYMDQERYVSFYQLGIIALLLMAMAWLLQRPTPIARRGIALVAIAVLLLQLPITWIAKQREPGIDAHNRQMAVSMALVARDPLHPPVSCASGMDLCVLPVEGRVALIGLLRNHRLSLFSPQYARRHRDDMAAVRAATGTP
ncbi:MAG: hypothetical protein ACREO8_00795 [Luteimonas sp.]